MKPTGHRSHVSGWRRFVRVFRKRDEQKDLARYLQSKQGKVVLDKPAKQ